MPRTERESESEREETAVAIYRMGNWSGAETRGKWENQMENGPGLKFGWSQMSGRRTSGTSRPSLGAQVLAVFSFIS